MPSRRRPNKAFTLSVEPWELELIRDVAKSFRTPDLKDLEAGLAKGLWELKSQKLSRVRNWKPYLARSLFNRAWSVVQKWRAHASRELTPALNSQSDEPFVAFESELEQLESRLDVDRVRRALDPASYALVLALADLDGNQSRAARVLGIHRNTIRRRLQEIRRKLGDCPNENVSTRRNPDRPQPRVTRLPLTPVEQRQLIQQSQSSGRRVAFRAQVILALAAGASYTKIAERLKTSAPTIARWKRRFVESGLEGLKARYRGKQPQPGLRVLLARWLRSASLRRHQLKRRWSYRRIARELGLSKSTVHRVLRTHPPCRRRT